MNDPIVQLIRRYIPALPHMGSWEFLSDSPAGPAERWPDLEDARRVLILADPGAGKTFEALDRARKLHGRGQKAFFIRIEAIDADFANAFEVGTADEFDAWLASNEEAWFFLDSVDEAQLATPRALEEAIRLFGARLHDARERAHVYITSREDAWQALSDRTLVDQHLPYGDPDELQSREGADDENSPSSVLKVFRLAPLKPDEIKLFASHHGVGDVNAFAAALERANLMTMAERPFDLKAIIGKWQADRVLGSRLDVLQRLVELQLASLSPAASPRIEARRAAAGAQALAAAVTLTGRNIICMPGGPMSADRLDPAEILPDWAPDELAALLESGVFDDVVYGSVRFRHREIRELLTARWAQNLLEHSDKRPEVEMLFVRASHGEDVIVPRLRPTLTWLILFDDRLRARALGLEPEVATEGGDPSQLPLDVRRSLLWEIVSRIASEREAVSMIDNSAIARVAMPDLTADVQSLVRRYRQNDDAIFFLGRLAWQGAMVDCVPDLLEIAKDSARGRYARVASIRAVMSLGDPGQQDELWTSIVREPAPLDRRLLAELLDGALPTVRSAELLIASIGQLGPHERFEVTGLEQAIRSFIDRLSLMADAAPEQPLARLVDDFNAILEREPHVERGECGISEQFAWLMGPALHAVERLVSGRAAAALRPSAIAVLLKGPELRFWRSDLASDYKTRLSDQVPRWSELNHMLYWASVAGRRDRLERRGERLTDDRQLGFFGHFWKLTAQDFDRCLAWISDKSDLDDRLIALSRCTSLYLDGDRPDEWLERLQNAVSAEPELAFHLNARLNPPPSPERDKHEANHLRWERKRERQERKERRDRAAWVRRLQAAPDRVRRPPGLNPGEFSNDQLHLMLSIPEERVSTRREDHANWRALIPEFGQPVAEAFRDAALDHWRIFQPGIRSEGADTSSTPYSLIFAMAGLEIEAGEDGLFSAGLTPEEASHALRYIIWELNGFPRWLEPLYRAHPDVALDFVTRELAWELQRSSAESPGRSLLHDLVYHAPWLHSEAAPFLLRWLSENDLPNADDLRYSLAILQGGGISPEDLAVLAKAKIEQDVGDAERPRWFALWVDSDPGPAIPALRTELERLSPAQASRFAEEFVVALLGGRHGTGTRLGAYRTTLHLKLLYVLMHEHVRASDDIERAGKGVYSPTLRDDAQDARNQLFTLLSEAPGKDTYAAIKALEEEHPDPSYRRWMALRARQRAIADADEPLWTTEKVRAFGAPAPKGEDTTETK